MKYSIEGIDISPKAGLYAKSVALRLKFMEHNIGLKDKDEWYSNYETIIDEIDYDEMDYGEQEQINKLIERIDYAAELKYYDRRLF